MKIIENIKKMINEKEDNSLKYAEEFDAILEDHNQEDKDYFRLRFINVYRDIVHGQLDKEIKIIDIKKDIFKFPKGFTKGDGLKVLSFLRDMIEEDPDIPCNTYRTIDLLNKILDIKELGFTKVSDEIEDKDIEDLYIVNGRLKLFKESSYYDNYFNWRMKDVSMKDFLEIYKRIGTNLEFENDNEVKKRESLEDNPQRFLKIKKGD